MMKQGSHSQLVACPICSRQIPEAVINMHLDAGCSALLPGTKRARQGSACAAASDPDSSQNLPEPKRARPAANGEAEGSAEPGSNADSQGQQQHQQNALHMLVQSSRALSNCRGAHHELSGEYLFPDFVSLEEEAQLIHMLDHQEPAWRDSSFNGRYRGKRWGVQMDLKAKTVHPADVPLPPLLLKLIARMQGQVPVLRGFKPNEANAIDYVHSEGHELRAHFDDRKMSTDTICTLSLCGKAVMTFTQVSGKQPGKAHSVRVPLPPRALQVLTKKARYDYTHAIARADLPPRRVSITFRQSPIKLA